MNLLPPLPIMEQWRLEGLTPQEVKARADAWIKEARQALGQPVLPRSKAPRPTLGQVSGDAYGPHASAGLKPGPVPGAKLKPSPKPGIPKRFPPRPKDGRSKPTRSVRPAQPSNRKLPSLEILVELYQTHTMQEIADMYQVWLNTVQIQLKKTNAVAEKRQARKQVREEKKAQKRPITPVNLKLPNLEQLEELYKTHSLREIAAMYGASTEAVAHHLRKTGAIERKRKAREVADLEQVRALRGQGMSWNEMAKTLKRGSSYLSRLAKEAGMETAFRMPFVCPKCDTKPYARGLCRRCYEWVRRNKDKLSPEAQARVKERAATARRPGTYRRGWKPETLERAQRLRALRQEGLTFKEIYRKTGIHDSTACTLLKRYERYCLEQAESSG